MHHPLNTVTHSLISNHSHTHTMDATVASLFTNQAVITTTTFKWKPKTLITIKKKNPSSASSSSSSSSSNVICFSSLSPPRPHHINHTHPYFYKNQKRLLQRTPPPRLPPSPPPPKNPTEHTTSLLDTFNQTQILRNLLINLQSQNSNPLKILQNDDDWTKEQFWLVVKYLKETSRSNEIIQVFDMWKNIEESRINEINYKDIIRLLCEVGLVEEAVSLLREMRTYDLNPNVAIYSFIINGFARKGDTDSALKFLKEMKENNLKPKAETFHELIRFYGNNGMYDEMGTYVKKIESEGCSPDHMTYNLLVMGFAQGGLLKRMERAYRTLLTKQMELKYPTVIAMLDTYANLEILDKLDEVFQRVSRSKIMLKEDTVRKVAGVYIKNYMFSKLEGLGNHVAATTGRTELVWCLRLLSQACQFSKRGMEYVVQDMEEANFCWTPTVLNIFALTYLKMGDLKLLKGFLSHLQKLKVRPDIVTAGVLFDAIPLGFDARGVLEIWKRMGYLDQAVDMVTDPLVLSAFKKGRFLRNCEEKYTSMGPEVRKKSVWTYQDLITMVLQNK